MQIGYARVSTGEQNLHLQRDMLEAAGCEVIYQDEGISGVTIERDGLTQALGALGEGDVLAVWKLDRLGRSLGFLCELVERLGNQRIGFQSLANGIDTSSSSGKLVFHIMGALAEFERDLIRERTRVGMKAAKKRGKHIPRKIGLPFSCLGVRTGPHDSLGRPKALSPAQVQHMRELLAAGKTQREVAEWLNVSANTVGREVKKGQL